VHLDVIASEGESRVLDNMRRKAVQAKQMFEEIIRQMNNAQKIERVNKNNKKMEMPSWL
jgi:hypothetical protein